jgi:dynein heavy chain
VLGEASVEVAKLNKQLADAQPEMEKTMAFVAEKKIVIAKENQEAEAVKTVVAADEAVAAAEAADVKAVKDSADADLAVALPALDEAVRKVRQINVNDFYELKGVGAPGPSIVSCFKTVILYFPDVKKGVKKPPKTDEKMTAIDPEGYWAAAKGVLLKDPKKFLRDLIDYDKDNIADATIEAAQVMLEREEMAEAKVKNASSALVAVRIWCKAMITYNTVLKIVTPKRALAAEKTI